MKENVVVVAALIVWVVFGQVGGAFPPGAIQNVTWALSSLGLVAASPLLALMFARDGKHLAAAGHAVLTIAAMMLYAGGPISTPGGQVSFASAILFYAPALLLIAAGDGHPRIARGLGAIAAGFFGVYGFRVLAGAAPTSIGASSAVSIGGYVFMTAAVVGWIVGRVRAPRLARAATV